MNSLDVLDSRILNHAELPPNLTISQWADEFRFLSPESSSQPGRWKTLAYQKEMMDVAGLPEVQQVTIQTSSQCGKSEILGNIIGYYVHFQPAPIMMIQPTHAMCQAFSKDRIAPMIRDTPVLSERIMDFRARGSANTLLHKSFAGGHLTIATSQSPSQLASRPIRILLADEVDRFPTSAGDEGDPLSLAIKRTLTFWNRKLIFTSTPTTKNYSRIEREYLNSDQRVFLVPCPKCKVFQQLKFERLRYEEADPRNTTRFVCSNCEHPIEEFEKRSIIDRGRWEAQAEFKGNAGFHINELYSPWKHWHEIVEDYLKAAKHEEMLRVFQNTSLGLTYETSVGSRLDWKCLYFANRDHYIEGRELLIDDVLLITCGVDVQGGRVELEVCGFAEDKRTFSLAYEVILGDTTQPDVWQKLTDYILNTKFKLRSTGAEIGIQLTAIDSGYQTQIVYNYCRKMGTKAIPIKGNPNLRAVAGLPRQVDITLKKQRVASGVKLFPLGVNVIKATLFAWLRLERPTGNEPFPSGFCMFPDYYDERYFQGLTSEAMAEEVYRGERRIVFKKNTDVACEPLDTRVYAIGAAEIAGWSRLNKDGWDCIRRELGILEPQRKPQEASKKKKKVMMDV